VKITPTAAAIGGALALTGLQFARRRTYYELAGKVVMITGGGRGLGLQIAREAAMHGAKLALCARSATELEAAAHEFYTRGTTVATSVCDVRDFDAVERTVAEFAERLGPVDVLINDAGIIESGPVDALTIADYRDAMDTNFFGALHAVEAVLPSMRERRAGRIVNITSIGGKVSVPHLLPYSTSKFAFVGYSEGLRAELVRDGIVVTTIVPGLMRTGSPPHATFAGQSRKEYALFALADALPGTSVGVEYAARQIIAACQRGDAERVISWQAKFAASAHAIAPGTFASAMAIVARLLPESGGSKAHRSGFESESALTRSPITGLSQHASTTQNETLDPGAGRS